MRKFLFIALFAMLAGCGSQETIQGENYGDLAGTDAGLLLTQSEHETGWGKSTCFDCHYLQNIHQNDRTGTGLNLAAIRYMTETEGLASCVNCHGSNGVP